MPNTDDRVIAVPAWAIRSWIARDPAAQTGWLGALRDQQIGRAIALVHRDPARNWTVASLAMAVGMSRSAFAARFSQLVGEPAAMPAHGWIFSCLSSIPMNCSIRRARVSAFFAV